MNDQTKLELAETLAPMTDDGRAAFIDGMADTPSAEDLAAIQALIANVADQAAEAVVVDSVDA